MSSKELIRVLFTLMLVLSVFGQLYALYTGQFMDNELPVPCVLFDIVLLLAAFFFSVEEKKGETKKDINYLPTPIKDRVQRNLSISKKIRIAQEKRDKEKESEHITTYPDNTTTLTPDESKAVLGAVKELHNTVELDEVTLQRIKDKRFKAMI